MNDDTLRDVLGDIDLLLGLEPEELAGYVFAHLHAARRPDQEAILYRGLKNLVDLGDLAIDKREEVVLALAEAWQWLEREGLIVARPYSGGFAITRRGSRLKTMADLRALAAARALPRELLHPRLVQRVWSAVLRGDYETAIFQAYREIEVAVRAAAECPTTDIGASLMRKAFDKVSGPLTDPAEPEPERESLSHLFAGAIGRFKNPASHRSVEYSLIDATEALMLASLLLRIVDERQSRKTGTPANQALHPTAVRPIVSGRG